jgi:hypothetical protein
MNSNKCANCGLVNGPHETVCRRCGQGLTVTPFVDAVIAEPPSWSTAQQSLEYPYAGYAPYAPPAGQPALVDRDQEHLRLLSIFHYVLAGLLALMGCFPIIHLVVGIGFIVGGGDTSSDPDGPPPAIVGWLIVGFASIFILFCWATAVAVLLAGRYIARRTHYAFCLAVAAVSCLYFPLGTVLGVFTMFVLLRSTVKPLFAKPRDFGRPDLGF